MEEKSMIAVISKYRKAIMGFAALWILAMHEWRLLIPYGESFWEREVFLRTSASAALIYSCCCRAWD